MEDYSCREEGTIIIPILQVNKVRPREEKKKNSPKVSPIASKGIAGIPT